MQGLVHPDRVFRKGGARPGDVLVLSKPLGTGLVLAGGTPSEKAAAIAGMRTLNRAASEALQSLGDAVHAVTDVTGYGLAGHGWEMAERSGVRVVVDTAGLVAYPGAPRPRPSAACAPAATRATATTWPATSTRRPAAGRRGAVLRPADVGRAAGRGRPGRRRRRWSAPAGGASARSRPASRARPGVAAGCGRAPR